MQEFEQILSISRQLADYFPDGIVFIGGVANYLHCLRHGHEYLAETSHDSDFYISLQDFADLRDIEEIVANRRLNKYQLIKQGYEFDIYVEHNHRLKIPFDEAIKEKVTINNIPCICLEHLLILKLDAYQDRYNSSKGDKDKRDIIRILNQMEKPNLEILNKYLNSDSIKLMKLAISSKITLQEMCRGNAKEASALWKNVSKNSRIILELETNENSL